MAEVIVVEVSHLIVTLGTALSPRYKYMRSSAIENLPTTIPLPPTLLQ